MRTATPSWNQGGDINILRFEGGNKTGDYTIKCIRHDSNEVITHVGVGSEIYTVEKIWNWITNNIHTFYTDEGGIRAKVYARVHPATGRKFLTTQPDGYDENNLDFLPYCPR